MLGYTEQKVKTLHVEDIHPQNDLPRILHEFPPDSPNLLTYQQNFHMLTNLKNSFIPVSCRERHAL
jgi:hypothetical protein